MSAPAVETGDHETRAKTVAVLAAWARVWSPLLTREERRPSWEALGLPGPIDDVEPDFWRLYHAAVPVPPVPLLLHSLLAMDGAQAREDWLRAIHHLSLAWKDRVLPPDHLAAACEVLAVAVEYDDRVLVAELMRRYVDPWCETATGRLAEYDCVAAALVGCFVDDLAALPR